MNFFVACGLQRLTGIAASTQIWLWPTSPRELVGNLTGIVQAASVLPITQNGSLTYNSKSAGCLLSIAISVLVMVSSTAGRNSCQNV